MRLDTRIFGEKTLLGERVGGMWSQWGKANEAEKEF